MTARAATPRPSRSTSARLAIREKALGPDHPDVGHSPQQPGRALSRPGPLRRGRAALPARARHQREGAGPRPPRRRPARSTTWPGSTTARAATPRPSRSTSARSPSARRRWAPTTPTSARSLNNLALLALGQRNWAQAADYWRRSHEIIERRAERGLAGSEGGSLKGEAVRLSWYFSGLVKMTDLLALQPDRARQGREMFETAQWAQASDAASSLTQMAARSAKGDMALAGLVRERQDLVGDWQAKDKQLIAAKSQLPAKRNPDAEKVLSDRLAAIDGRLNAIDERFARDFPEYASLTSPKPTSVAEVQALLGPSEALVVFLDTSESNPIPEETFIWLITKSDVRWVKSELGTKALSERVVALRCGLDAALWDDEPAAARCRSLVKTAPERDPYGNVATKRSPSTRPGPTRSIRPLCAGRGPHQGQAPAPRAVRRADTAALPGADHREARPGARGTELPPRAWLARSHALTVLPSVSSLKALRQLGQGQPMPTAR